MTGRDKRHNIVNWGSNHPHKTVEYKRKFQR